jgi:nucleoside-diphosphate-sugar epimerase
MSNEAPVALEQAATVINAAGPRARPGLGSADYFREHVGTSRAIVRAMKPGAHLIHLSSTAVFGARGVQLRCDSLEAPLLFPMPAYASGKYAAELAVRALCEERGIQLTILRLSMVYGPGVDSALESLVKMAARGMRLELKPGSLRQHLLHMELLVYGLLQACKCGPQGPRPLILADPFSITNNEINAAIARMFPKAFSASVPLCIFGKMAKRCGRLAEFRVSMPIASFAVLAIDNEFDWQPGFQALGIEPSDFDRSHTLGKYLS